MISPAAILFTTSWSSACVLSTGYLMTSRNRYLYSFRRWWKILFLCFAFDTTRVDRVHLHGFYIVPISLTGGVCSSEKSFVNGTVAGGEKGLERRRTCVRLYLLPRFQTLKHFLYTPASVLRHLSCHSSCAYTNRMRLGMRSSILLCGMQHAVDGNTRSTRRW